MISRTITDSWGLKSFLPSCRHILVFLRRGDTSRFAFIFMGGRKEGRNGRALFLLYFRLLLLLSVLKSQDGTDKSEGISLDGRRKRKRSGVFGNVRVTGGMLVWSSARLNEGKAIRETT